MVLDVVVRFEEESGDDPELIAYLKNTTDVGKQAKNLIIWAYCARTQGNVAYTEFQTDVHYDEVKQLRAKYEIEKNTQLVEYNSQLKELEASQSEQMKQMQVDYELEKKALNTEYNNQIGALRTHLKNLEAMAHDAIEDRVVQRIQSLEKQYKTQLESKDSVIRQLTVDTDERINQRILQIEQLYHSQLQSKEAIITKLTEKANLELEISNLKNVRSSTSVFKGKDTENSLIQWLTEIFPQYQFENTSKQAHSADFHLFTPRGRIVFECKNKLTLTNEDSQKYRSDLLRVQSVHERQPTQVIGGVFINLGTTKNVSISTSMVGTIPSLTLHVTDDFFQFKSILQIFIHMCTKLAPSLDSHIDEDLDDDAENPPNATLAMVEKFNAITPKLKKDIESARKNAVTILNALERALKHTIELELML